MIRRKKQQPIFTALSELKSEQATSARVEPRKTSGLAVPTANRHTDSHVNPGPVIENRCRTDPFTSLDFVYIPPGTFLMGSPPEEVGRHQGEVLHEVALEKGFHIQASLVTKKQWVSVVGSDHSFRGRDAQCPVDNVSWNDCQRFIEALNALGSHKYRLPTEAEWEYACRAGTSTAFNKKEIQFDENDNAVGLSSIAWYASNSEGRAHPVAQKEPNAWGLFDMHGNLCEWCEDWHGPYPLTRKIDPVGRQNSSGRVCRGGCWISVAENCRSAVRFFWEPGYKSDFIGFRLVREES